MSKRFHGKVGRFATITGEVLGTPNAKMKEMLGGDQPKLFTPWMVMRDEKARPDQGWIS